MSDYPKGSCPKCGSNLYTEDAILVYCSECDFISSDITLLSISSDVEDKYKSMIDDITK